MEHVTDLVLLFFLYSFFGWCMEVTLKYIQFHRFINRGFLTGPICPIYGTGAILITVAVEWLTPLEKAYGTTFAISFVLCGAVEYFTSWYMEKRFHARWWDYSQKPMNLHGRIWIGNLVLFGLGGVGIVHFFNPPMFAFLSGVNPMGKGILASGMTALCAADYVMTHFVLKLVKVGVESSQADNTEEISREVRMLLSDRSMFYRRFADAYPEVIYRTDRVKERIARVRAESERIRKEAESRVQEVSARVEQMAEPTAMVKSGLIEKQRKLIALLYNEERASEAERELKALIDADLERLESRPSVRIENRIRKA